MNEAVEPAATLRGGEIGRLFEALAGPEPRAAVLQVIDSIAAARMQVSVFSAGICLLETLEVVRIYSSRPLAYSVGTRKNKRGTAWAQQVMVERRVFVGEGPLEMAAAFDDQEGMARQGIRSLINVPIVAADRCLGVLNFGRSVERVLPGDVLMARMLALAATAVFADAAASASVVTDLRASSGLGAAVAETQAPVADVIAMPVDRRSA